MRKRTTKHANERGAALVEALIVMPFMVTFLGMMIWFHNIYKVKQDVMLQARGQMLSYASHSCGGSPPPADGSANGLYGDAQKARSASGGVNSALSLAFNVQSKHAEGKASGKYRTTAGWNKTLNHDSYSMCNERRLDGGLLDLIPFGIGLAKGMF
ncbi:hypothetical protein LZC95_22065 [Pendulispora brunnea]|uniref:TadE-like protein n=1 Tax=Pendulispora brunnea TaxID=2905690 RepID=A0ABZ2KLG4_9BACT